MSVILSPSQQAVIEAFPGFLMDDSKELTISGFAGSGKTFLMQYLADMGEKQQKLVKLLDPSVPRRRMVFSATTNKAATVLQDFLRKDVQTIHSLLGLSVQNDYKTGKQKLVPKNRPISLVNTIIYIDEASMIDEYLLANIRNYTGKVRSCKVVYIGDSYQLPPVMEDICAVFTNPTSTIFLKEIQRQVADSPIIQLSAQYRNVLDDPSVGWPKLQNMGDAIVHHTDKNTFFKAIAGAYKQPHEPNDLKILAWSNNRVRDYNRWVRSFSNYTKPYETGEIIVTNKPLFVGQTIVAPTDSLHMIKSCTDAIKEGIRGYAIQIMGLEETFFQPADWKEATVLANKYKKDAHQTKNWKPFFAIKEQWTDLRPVHASTVHKAQGSTYNEVFVDLNNIGKCNNWRDVARLAYVAITRARHRVHIYGNLSRNYSMGQKPDLTEPFKHVNTLSSQ